MAWVTAPSETLAGLGLVVVGAEFARRALRAGMGAVLVRSATPAARGGPHAYALGALTAVAPSTTAQARALVALASSGLVCLSGLFGAGVASLAGFALSALVLALAVAVPTFQAAAAVVLGLAAGVRWLGGPRAARAACELLVSWGLVALGTRLLAEGLAASGGLRLDGLPIGLAGQALAVFVSGLVVGAATRRSLPLLALAIAGAVSGALLPTGAAALACAALAVSGVEAWLAMPSERGDGKRAALMLGMLHLAGAALGLFLLALCLPWLVPSTGTGASAALRVAGFVALVVLLVHAVCLPLAGKIVTLVEESVTSDQGVGAGSLDLPELLVAGAEWRQDRAGTVVRNMARAVLVGEGVTSFRLDQDRAEIDALQREIEGLAARANADGLDAQLATRLAAAVGPVRHLPRLLEELVVLMTERTAQDGRLPVDLRAGLHGLESTLLRLHEGALAPGAAERLPALYEDAAALEAELGRLESHLVATTATGVVAPDLALALLWRAGRLRALGTALVVIAESSSVATGVHEPSSWAHLWQGVRQWRAAQRAVATVEGAEDFGGEEMLADAAGEPVLYADDPPAVQDLAERAA